MAIEDTFFNVQISLTQARTASDSFGIAMLLTHSASWVERVRSYTGIDSVEEDFPAGTVEHLQASAFFDQEPRPNILKIGRCANVPTIRWAVTPVAVDDATYAGRVVEADGTENDFEYVAGTMVDLPYNTQTANFHAGRTLTGGTSGAKAIILSDTDGGATGTLRLVGIRGGPFTVGEIITEDGGTPGSATAGTQAAVTGVAATVNEIVNGLRSMLDELDLDLTFSDQTTFMRAVADSAGDWFALEVLDPTKLGIKMDHADPGYAADLSAIQTEDGDWFALLDAFPSEDVVDAVADWTESRAKMFVTVTQDSKVETDVVSGATDILADLQAATRSNVFVIYRRRPSEFTCAGLMGVIMPIAPGGETHAFKTVSGSTPDSLTDAQLTNVLAKNGNAYVVFAGQNRTLEGKVPSGLFADDVRFKFWQISDVQIAVANAVTEPNKLPMTDEGIAVVQSATLASLKRGVAAGGLRADPAPVVNVPKVEDIPEADRADRILSGIEGLAYRAGAIHKVNPLRITFTV